MVIGACIYLMLHVVFIGALAAGALSHHWAHLRFANSRGPFAGILLGVDLGGLAYVLHADALISPSGSALVYLTTSSRLTYAMAKNRSVSAFFERSGARSQVPVVGLLFSYVVSLILFFPFPGRQSLVRFVTSATVLMCAGAPLASGASRRQQPNVPRPFRLPTASVLAPAGFILANLIIYWGGRTTDWKQYVAIGLGYLLMAVSGTSSAHPRHFRWDWRAAVWWWPYLGGMALISFLGQFGGGRAVIPVWWDIAVVAGWSLVIYGAAMVLRLPDATVDGYVSEVDSVED